MGGSGGASLLKSRIFETPHKAHMLSRSVLTKGVSILCVFVILVYHTCIVHTRTVWTNFLSRRNMELPKNSDFERVVQKSCWLYFDRYEVLS